MSTWLDTSIRYYQSEAIAARRKADEMRDPAWVAHQVRKLERDRRQLLNRARDLAWQAEALRDDVKREGEIQRNERDAARWEQMAEEHETFRERKEAGLFEEPA